MDRILGMSQDLFAITSYYNPASYKRRLSNYHIFRQNLNVPLITVELGNQGKYELKPGDADILVQIPQGDILWQKERLLNVALKHVPSEAEAIAWIDCDVIFGRKDWVGATLEKLKEFPLVQLFHEACYMDRDVMPGDGNGEPAGQRHDSITARMQADSNSGVASDPDYLPLYHPKRVPMALPGLAWAARRTLLEPDFFYDSFILGGGDCPLIYSAYGWFDEIISQYYLNFQQKLHYLAWAKTFCEKINTKVGFIKNRLFHLWHGEMVDRGYWIRHQKMSPFAFDPHLDIRIGKDGAWLWASDKPEMHAFFKNYFHQRFEDGRDRQFFPFNAGPGIEKR